MAERIRLSRAKGWRLPPNTVVVSRPGPWGNPFVVGKDGTRAECVDLYRHLLSGLLCVSRPMATVDAQRRALHYALAHIGELRGKNLACWCSLGPCHADVLLEAANDPRPADKETRR